MRVRLLIALCLSVLLGGLVVWTLAQDGQPAKQPTATPLEASATPSGNYVSVDARLAYVRSGPGRNYDILGQLQPGQRVVPVSRDVTGNWILIRYQDEEQSFDGFAWIARNLVRWVNPSGLSRLPVLKADALTPSATFTTTPTPSATFTPSATPTSTSTPSDTPTATSTSTPSDTPTTTATATSTMTATATATATHTATNTPATTATATNTMTATATATATHTATNTPTATETATNTMTATATATATHTATNTPSATPTSTATATETSTSTVTPTSTATATERPTSAATATETSTSTVTPTSTATATERPTSAATATETSTSTVTPTSTATATETPTSTATATETPTSTATATETSTSTVTPSETPAVLPLPTTPAPAPAPTLTPAGDPEQPTGSRVELGLALTILALVALYVLAYWRASGLAARFGGGFLSETCPVCQAGRLHVENRPERFLGLPDVRHTVRCDQCRSVLREVRPRIWRYTVDPLANPPLYAQINNRELSEAALLVILKPTQPQFVDEDTNRL